MTIKKRGLGRGLEALLANVSTTEEKHQLQTLPINTLQKSIHLSPDDMNSDELTMPDTLEPVAVQKIVGNNDDEMDAGEISWRAARLAGSQEIPAIIKERDDREAMAIALIETIQKENLKLVQEAEDLRKLIDEFEAMVRRL